MTQRKKYWAILKIALLLTTLLSLSSCDRGLEIVSVDVTQLPYRTVYIAEADNSLDMQGCIISIRVRDGRVREVSFEEETRASIRHEIDFSTPGEYEVFFYWGEETHIHTMIIQVIAPN